jgi:hypothetical protein
MVDHPRDGEPFVSGTYARIWLTMYTMAASASVSFSRRRSMPNRG